MSMTLSGSNGITFNDASTQSTGKQACKAWVNFDGTNGSIRNSYNVSSVTRNATADYTVNFSTAMPNANYVTTLSGQRNYAGSKDAGFCLMRAGTSIQQTASSFQFYTVDQAMNSNDALVAMIAVFGS